MADNSILTRLDGLKLKYEEIGQKLTDPEVIADVKQFIQFNKEYRELEPIIEASERYRTAIANLTEAKDILANDKDEEMREMARGEIAELEPKIETLEEEIKLLLIPKDPQDAKNAIVEIRGGAGGEESCLFAAELMRMYIRYAERHHFRVEPISTTETELGGIKEAVFSIAGSGVFARMKYESGVHRVQRVPITESNGKIQSSTCTVAVLPEAEDVELQIDPKDLRIDVYRSTGHGGQCVNTTDSAVRITHLPTGLVVTCQDQKSQLKNRDTAMQVLRSRLLAKMRAEKDAAYAENRRVQVGTGDRSERIRTYNFREGRVTDHRIGLTLYRIQDIIDGDLDEIIDALHAEEIVERLREMR